MKTKKIQKKEILSPLKWAGGKRWLAPTIKKLYQKHANGFRLIEPFCGACSVALEIKPHKALLNDINSLLIIFWNEIKITGKIFVAGSNNEAEYDKIRQYFNEVIISEKLYNQKNQSHIIASFFYYLNRTCYNGLFRVNKKGLFNVPFGKYKTISYQYDFRDLQEIIREWEFSSKSYKDLELTANDFVYVDPPYHEGFCAFSKEGFSEQAQEELAIWLSKSKSKLVVSNSCTPFIVKLYKSLGFKVTQTLAPRRISCNGDRLKCLEVLMFKNI